MQPFFASFNKKYEHRDCEYRKKELGWNYEFKKAVFERVSRNIKAVLGDKDKYTCADVFLYFQQRFFAYPVGISQYYDYANTENPRFDISDRPTVSKNADIESLAEEGGQFYPYLGENAEHSLVFVIDANIHNAIRKKRPQLALDFGEVKGNFLIAIGSLDGKNINSMKILLGENYIYGVIPDLGYIFEFFRQNG